MSLFVASPVQPDTRSRFATKAWSNLQAADDMPRDPNEAVINRATARRRR